MTKKNMVYALVGLIFGFCGGVLVNKYSPSQKDPCVSNGGEWLGLMRGMCQFPDEIKDFYSKIPLQDKQ